MLDDPGVLERVAGTENAARRAGAKADRATYLGATVVDTTATSGLRMIACTFDSDLKHPAAFPAGAHTGSNSAWVVPVA